MSDIADKRKHSMFSRNIWHPKQKNLCLKIWQLTLRHLKTREQAHQQLPVAGSAV